MRQRAKPQDIEHKFALVREEVRRVRCSGLPMWVVEVMRAVHPVSILHV